MAEAFLRSHLAAAGVPAVVRSAGLLESGNPASASGVELMAGRGLDLRAHRSATVSAAILREADLILGMAREHVREAVVLDAGLWPRTFTLKELVRRGEATGPRQAGETLGEWLARVGQGRRISDLTGSSSADDIADPIGGPRSAYERLAAELDDLLDRLVADAFAGALSPR